MDFRAIKKDRSYKINRGLFFKEKAQKQLLASMAISSKLLLTLMCRYFCALSFLSTRHIVELLTIVVIPLC